MRAYLSRRYRFSASHRLHAQTLSDAENRTAFGKCNNPFGHGHNYVVEVTFGGSIDPRTGMVVSLSELDAFAQKHVLDRFDRTNLNMDAMFAELVPTTENLSVELHRIFECFPYGRLERVHVEETSNNSFEFCGPDYLARRS